MKLILLLFLIVVLLLINNLNAPTINLVEKPSLNRRNIAIIVPFRNGEENWVIFIEYMHEYFKKDKSKNITILRVEQSGDQSFNRGKLSNTCLVLALQNNKTFDCIVIHDVDLLPFPGVAYDECQEHLVHLSNSFSHLRWKSRYHTYFGGVVSMKPEHWKK